MRSTGRFSSTGRFKGLAIAATVLMLGACSTAQEDSALVTGAGAGSGQQSASAAPGAPSPGTTQDFQVNVGDRVFFGYDQYDLSPEARSVLERQAAWLQAYPQVNLLIEGHADERGTREYNLALGERRAASIRSYLVALGVSPSRLSTVSYGKERPAVVGSNDQSWAQNRRGVSVVN